MQKKLKIDLLKDMLLTRTVEQMISENYPSKEIRCPVHLSIGQEAISAGVSKALKKKILFLVLTGVMLIIYLKEVRYVDY